MNLKKAILITSHTLLCLVFGAPQVELQYQNRGNRNEGLRPKPVSGGDIELISATVNYQEASRPLPDLFRLKLYLQQQTQVYVIVREIDNKHDYWMDKVRPSQPWKAGFDNVFEWPAKNILRNFNDLEMYDLGAVARLDKPEPSKIERVAPLIFYHSHPPDIVKGYLFTFKIKQPARMNFSVYLEGKKVPEFTISKPRLTGRRPFTVQWDNAPNAPGLYKLVGDGFYLDNNRPVDQTVYFYHQPNVKGG